MLRQQPPHPNSTRTSQRCWGSADLMEDKQKEHPSPTPPIGRQQQPSRPQEEDQFFRYWNQLPCELHTSSSDVNPTERQQKTRHQYGGAPLSFHGVTINSNRGRPMPRRSWTGISADGADNKSTKCMIVRAPIFTPSIPTASSSLFIEKAAGAAEVDVQKNPVANERLMHFSTSREVNFRASGKPAVSNLCGREQDRRRTQKLNCAFARLRACLPSVPRDTKLSKLRTLRAAIFYIRHLTAATACTTRLRKGEEVAILPIRNRL